MLHVEDSYLGYPRFEGPRYGCSVLRLWFWIEMLDLSGTERTRALGLGIQDVWFQCGSFQAALMISGLQLDGIFLLH